MSLEDVRAAIDHIDDEILTLLARRREHVRDAARYKRDEHAVRAPERRAAMLRRLRERAEVVGIEPEVVDAIWNAMIDAFIEVELREHRQL